MNKTGDQILRSMTSDGAFRVITILSTDTVQTAISAQSATGVTAQKLGELMTGAVLIRQAMSPERRVQMLVKDQSGRTRLVADSQPSGKNRGIVNPGDKAQLDMGESAVLEVLYTLTNDVLQQGIVNFAGDADISTALMTYMQKSEQITTMIAVHTSVDDQARVVTSGGYLVQLMPNASFQALAHMTSRLSHFTDLPERLRDPELSVETLRDALLGTMECKEMARQDICFGCSCDRARIFVGLASLPDEDIAELIASGETVEARCDACGTHYQLEPSELAILQPASN